MHPEKRGLPVHKWMYSVYEKGGKINIEKFDECTEKDWEEREQYWIDFYKKSGHNLTNIDKGGKGVITSEKRAKSSIERSAEKHRKPVVAYNLDGTKFMEFESVSKAAEHFHVNINNVGMAVQGHIKSACGYMWKYRSENLESVPPYKKNTTGKKVYQFNFDGTLVQKFESGKAAINFFGVNSQSSLLRAINNHTNYKGFFWSFNSSINVSDYVSPYKYKIIKGENVIKVIEQKEIANILNICKSSVSVRLKEGDGEFRYNEYLIQKI